MFRVLFQKAITSAHEKSRCPDSSKTSVIIILQGAKNVPALQNHLKNGWKGTSPKITVEAICHTAHFIVNAIVVCRAHYII